MAWVRPALPRETVLLRRIWLKVGSVARSNVSTTINPDGVGASVATKVTDGFPFCGANGSELTSSCAPSAGDAGVALNVVFVGKEGDGVDEVVGTGDGADGDVVPWLPHANV